MRRAESKGYRGVGMDGLIATWYARNTEKDLEEYKTLARRVAAFVEAGAKILEVAPGPGYFVIELAKIGDFKITALDISPSFVEIARNKAADAGVDIEFRQGDVALMPFEAGSYDFIVCRAAFKNFSEPVKALREMHRVLKPGGQALIEDLRRDVSREAIDSYVNHMGLTWINAFFTKWIFRFMLIRRAYVKDEIEGFVSQTDFRKHEIQEDRMGLEIVLTR